MTRPAVVFVHAPDPLTRMGGGERYALAHARAARRAGFDVHMFCVSDRTGVQEDEIGRVHRVWSPVRPFRNLMLAGHGPFLTRALRRFLRARTGPHLLHGFGASTGSLLGVAPGPGRPVARVATVWDCLYEESLAKYAGVDPAQGWRGRVNPAIEVAWNALLMRRYEARSFQRADAVFVNYDSVRQLLVSRYGVDDARIRRTPYAPETAFLPVPDAAPPATIAALRQSGAPVIVVMSRHVPRKGLVHLLHALHRLKREGVAFRACLVGGGYLLEHHRALARELGLGAWVQIVGRVPETFDYVRHADLFVLPSLEEGSGSMSMLEAMQAGVALVATRIDGIPEDVTDGADALLVPPADDKALAAAIRRLLEDAALRRRLGAAARQTFQARFSAEALVAGLTEAYLDVGRAAGF